jgi:hypothetical protein
MMILRIGIGLACVLCAAGATAQRARPETTPAGAPKATDTRVLESGAKILQGNAPLAGFDICLDGFHPMKDHPEMQVEAHRFCRQVNEDLAQCVLFDGNTRTANLNGIEYIISEKLYAMLPAGERQYWHPHNGEILRGLLVARDTRMNAHTDAKRKARTDLKALAHPQTGVDALKGKFPQATQDIPGVVATKED